MRADNKWKTIVQEIAGRLIADSIDKVVVWFSGSGDSGQIDSVVFYSSERRVRAPVAEIVVPTNTTSFVNGEWKKVTEDASLSIEDAICELVNEMLDETDVDWYNNNGGQGEWIWQVMDNKLMFYVDVNIMEQVNEYTYSGELI